MKDICRIYVSDDLKKDHHLEFDHAKTHYLMNVLRKRCGDTLRLFNGKDGEWLGEILDHKKKSVLIKILKNLRPQFLNQELRLVFSPLKQARLKFLVEKSVELGVTELIPVLTEYTSVRDFNYDRMKSIAIEAAEQCERLSIPIIHPLISLSHFLKNWPQEKTLFMGDERLNSPSLIRVILNESPLVPSLMIGPEGGFSAQEFKVLSTYDFIRFVNLGKTILRAETAALAGLAICHLSEEIRSNS